MNSQVAERGILDSPLLHVPCSEPALSPIRRFTALEQPKLLILGPRRNPPVTCPVSNSDLSVAISTSVGFCQLSSDDYIESALRCLPDVIVGFGDIPHGDAPGHRRREKMVARTEKWIRALTAAIARHTDTVGSKATPGLFAPILPLSLESQSSYLASLADEFRSSLAGLVIYEASSAASLPDAFNALPRLSMTNVMTPNQILQEVTLGIDLFTVPFVGLATDAGIALEFTFPAATQHPATSRHSLGIDMWSAVHATELQPIGPNCRCYSCTKHTRAYIQHLLSAKEMLAWVLLQVHNLAVLDRFFAGIRDSIRRGSFEEDRLRFEAAYEPGLPDRTGQGPRVRGYQFKSEGPNEPKRNPAVFQAFDKTSRGNISPLAPDEPTTARDLENKGFGVAPG